MEPACAFKPIAEQACRSTQTIAPRRVISAPAIMTVIRNRRFLRGALGIIWLLMIPCAQAVRIWGELEPYGLEELTYLGTVRGENEIVATVRDPHGQLHAVRVNQYVGKNSGRVVVIKEWEILLMEQVMDANGNWHERPNILLREVER